ncbi:hypothetical protein ACOME3_005385 [Neoechinorhynchus agilis]
MKKMFSHAQYFNLSFGAHKDVLFEDAEKFIDEMTTDIKDITSMDNRILQNQNDDINGLSSLGIKEILDYKMPIVDEQEMIDQSHQTTMEILNKIDDIHRLEPNGGPLRKIVREKQEFLTHLKQLNAILHRKEEDNKSLKVSMVKIQQFKSDDIERMVVEASAEEMSEAIRLIECRRRTLSLVLSELRSIFEVVPMDYVKRNYSHDKCNCLNEILMDWV